MIKQIFINRRYIAKIASTITCSIYAFWGLIGTFAPIDDILPETMAMPKRIAISLAVLIGFWCICFIGTSVYLVRQKRYAAIKANNGHCLYLQYGDLFGANEIITATERKNIIIPVNCCFDTIVDDKLISKKTLHGAAINHLCSDCNYSLESLNTLIQDQLATKPYITLSLDQKPSGNCKRYQVGTIVDIPEKGEDHYFLWALSSFDNDLKAHTTLDDYTLAVQKLVEACNTMAEGYPVLVPLAGTGLSRTNKNQNDLLAYLVSVFRLNKDIINCDIHIIVNEKIRNDIPIMGIK